MAEKASGLERLSNGAQARRQLTEASRQLLTEASRLPIAFCSLSDIIISRAAAVVERF